MLFKISNVILNLEYNLKNIKNNKNGLLFWCKFDLVSRFLLIIKKMIKEFNNSCSNGCCKDSCCEFHQTITAPTLATVSSIWMPTATLVFNIVICLLFLLLIVLVTWFLMRDKKRQWSNLRTRLTQSFSRFTMVSYVNNNDAVNIS